MKIPNRLIKFDKLHLIRVEINPVIKHFRLISKSRIKDIKNRISAKKKKL